MKIKLLILLAIFLGLVYLFYRYQDQIFEKPVYSEKDRARLDSILLDNQPALPENPSE